MSTVMRLVLLTVLIVIVGSTAQPLRVGPSRTYTSLAQVVDIVNPGDTVLVDGDNTYTGGVIFERPGAANRPIVIKGIRINGRRPILSGGTNTITFATPNPPSAGADHYIMEGFEVTGGTFRGIYHQADDLTIRDVVVHDCAAHGILGADIGSGSCTMEFVEVYRCGSGSSQHQIYMSTDQVNRPGSVFRMKWCYLHDAKGGNNVKSRSERNEIYYNWIEGGYYHELELIGPDPNGVDDGWTPHLKREDSDVVGNVLFKRRTAADNDSNFSVVRIGGDATGESHGRYRFVNNTIISGSGSVFRCFDSLQSLEAHNNVFYRISGAPNMMRVVEAAWTQGAAVIAGSNNWVKTGATNTPSAWTGTISGTDPGFASIAGMDLAPASTSALINAGNATPSGPAGFALPQPLALPLYLPPLHRADTTAFARPVAAGIDIGAFENSSSSILSRFGRSPLLRSGASGQHMFDARGRKWPGTPTAHGVVVVRETGLAGLRTTVR